MATVAVVTDSAINSPKAVEIIMEHVGNEVGGWTVHADALAEAEALRGRMAEQFACAELHVVEFTPAMGTHTWAQVSSAWPSNRSE